MRTAFVGFLLLIWVVSCTSPPPPPKKPASPPVAVEQAAPAPVEFPVTAEKKQTSLAQIRVLVDQLNDLIARQDFSDWVTHLDQDYIRVYSDPVKLRDVTARDPVLKSLSLKLRTLEDYFKFEVVPSRANTKVDDITFLDENRVYVWTVVDNERFLLYLLKLYGKEWKISTW